MNGIDCLADTNALIEPTLSYAYFKTTMNAPLSAF